MEAEKLVFAVRRDAPTLERAWHDLGFSTRTYKTYAFSEAIRIDGCIPHRSHPVREGARIEVTLRDEHMPEGHEAPEAAVLYEDRHVMAVVKPAGLLTHESKHFDGVTFRDYVRASFLARGVDRPVRWINRLDRDTSGILLVAKHDIAQAFYQALLPKGLKREYIALISGHLAQKTAVDVPIGRDIDCGIKRTLDPERGQSAKTIFTPLYAEGAHSVIRAEILTGRTHQIRLHLNHLGCSVVGDGLYGTSDPSLRGQALHAYRIRTRTLEGAPMDLFAPLPEDMFACIQKVFAPST